MSAFDAAESRARRRQPPRLVHHRRTDQRNSTRRSASRRAGRALETLRTHRAPCVGQSGSGRADSPNEHRGDLTAAFAVDMLRLVGASLARSGGEVVILRDLWLATVAGR